MRAIVFADLLFWRLQALPGSESESEMRAGYSSGVQLRNGMVGIALSSLELG
jgi:hypothetical protein